jgi:hypothetical protein
MRMTLVLWMLEVPKAAISPSRPGGPERAGAEN